MNLTPWRKKEVEERSGYPLSMDQYLNYFTYGNNMYPLGLNQTLRGQSEELSGDFPGLIAGAYKSNGVVFACMLSRMLLFSEARFQFRQIRSGRPGNLFGNADLAVLESPSPGHTTGDMLTRAIQDADLAGNWFGLRERDKLRRMRPDWVSIVLGSKLDKEEASVQHDAEVLGYLYHPGGYNSGYDPVAFLADEVAHFAPIPDPSANFRGMSWLTPVIREIMADSSARDHKLKFFENGATSNMVVRFPETVRKEAFESAVEMFKAKHEGLANAYKTIVLGGGADATVVGANFQQMEFKTVQGAGETRIAAAAGVPPIIVGLSEGLASATYSNYGQARRRFSDGTMRPLWRNMAGSLAQIIKVPAGAELWYDDRDIPFLKEDQKDAAEVQQLQATAIKTLVDAGYDTQSVIDAITSGDMTRLQHTGLVSVQLQPPGAPVAASNGSSALVLP